jgi:hypothetical protein
MAKDDAQLKRKSPDDGVGAQNSNKKPRKQPDHKKKASKRVQITGQRQFHTELGKAVFKDGRVDVPAFVQAREKEIVAMEEGMMRQKYAIKQTTRLTSI